MRLKKAPYTEFKMISTSLDDFSPLGSSPVFMINNIPMMDLELKDHDLISYMNPTCPQCLSRNVVKNGTCIRTMENGITFRIQRYICRDCRYSFVARPPNYGYGKHYPDDIRDKNIRTRVKTSLRKVANIFYTIGRVIISHETVRKYVPPLTVSTMESSLS
ncbi:MAG: hypothetical protein QXU79_01960 [Candidatus Micrarchaeaceae archaeon]